MKNLKLWLLGTAGVFVLISAAVAQTPPVSVPHVYGVEHAVIEYEISGAVKGKKTLYFDQWGMRQARHKVAETQRWGTTSTVTLNLGADIVIYDPNKNLGQKKEDIVLKQLLANFKPEDVKLLSVLALELSSGKKIKDETFLDRPCEVWETAEPKTKTWVCEGMALKIQEETPEGVVISTAVSVDLTTPIDENLFLVPEAVRLIDHDINEILIS